MIHLQSSSSVTTTTQPSLTTATPENPPQGYRCRPSVRLPLTQVCPEATYALKSTPSTASSTLRVSAKTCREVSEEYVETM